MFDHIQDNEEDIEELDYDEDPLLKKSCMLLFRT